MPMNESSYLVCFVFILVASVVQTAADERVCVVLMHGKLGTSGPRSPITPLVRGLISSGISVIAPEMSWSKSRQFDKTVDESMVEIDVAVEQLRNRGCWKIFVAGHSLGANIALRYVATRAGVHGVIAIAPGHVPERPGWQERLARDLDIARTMIGEGKGDELTYFRDITQGEERAIYIRPDVYVSFHDPNGLAVMPRSASEIRTGTALLWIVGEFDRMFRRGPDYAFNKAPPHEKSKYLVVPGGHRATPDVSKKQIIEWIKSF